MGDSVQDLARTPIAELSASTAISAAISDFADWLWPDPFRPRPMLIGKTRPVTYGRRTSTKVS